MQPFVAANLKNHITLRIYNEETYRILHVWFLSIYCESRNSVRFFEETGLQRGHQLIKPSPNVANTSFNLIARSCESFTKKKRQSYNDNNT